MCQVSGREAATILGAHGLSRQQARRVLLGGLGGPGTRLRGAILYDADAVLELAAWGSLDREGLAIACPTGLFVLRLGTGHELDVAMPWTGRAAAVANVPELNPLARVRMRTTIERDGLLPFVATVCGYPVVFADVHDVRPAGQGSSHLILEPPSSWCEPLARQRLVTGRGPTWMLIDPVRWRGLRRPGHRLQE